VLYDGRITRELVGDAITERALVASALNVETGGAARMPAMGA
jgi:ribose transport system ATP-binding protein